MSERDCSPTTRSITERDCTPTTKSITERDCTPTTRRTETSYYRNVILQVSGNNIEDIQVK